MTTSLRPPSAASIDPRLAAAFRTANGFPLAPHLLTLQIVGSQSHNTALSVDDPSAATDTDLVGIVIPPFARTVGLSPWTSWNFRQDELDVNVYSLSHFVDTLVKSSPNALAMLWGRPEHELASSLLWATLVAQRALFTTKAAYLPFVAYGESQFKRMQPFDAAAKAAWDAAANVVRLAGWTPEDVVANAARPMPYPDGPSKDALAAACDTLEGMHTTFFHGKLGAKRKGLVEQFGFDVKMGAHTVRLVRMIAELLETGTLNVFRTTDAAELRAIKRGDYPLEHVRDLVAPLFARAAAARETSTLPERVDRTAANALLVQLYRASWGVDASVA